VGKTLIVGLGNTILSDDAAGLLIAREVYARVKSESVDFIESSYAGWRCIDFFPGYEKIIIIDVICDPLHRPGECFKMDLPKTIPLHRQSSHNVGFLEMLELARQTGMVTATRIVVYAVAARTIYDFSEHISEQIMNKVPDILSEIIKNEFPGMPREGGRFYA
jgi:hydrogenase maturation protease